MTATAKNYRPLGVFESIFRKFRSKNRIVPQIYFDSQRYTNAEPAEEAQIEETFSSTSQTIRSPDLRLVCSEMDRHGNLLIRKGRFSKASLCSSLGLQARDLRKLDGTLKNQLPSFLIRPSTILVNLEGIRAVIKCDRVTLFSSEEGETGASLVLKDLQAKLKHLNHASAPFEFIVLEAVLQTTLQNLQDEFEKMAPSIEQHLTILERFVHWDKLKSMLECKKRVASFHERINSVRNCISEVLDSDADMAAMYLTAKSSNSQPRPVYAHEEMELLLESYLKIAEEIASRVQLLASNIQSTEDIVNIGLVGQRNELLLLELKLVIGTFAASMGGFGATILGMNLQNGFESSPEAFWLVVSSLVSISLFSFTSSWRKMLKLVRKF